MSVARRRWAIGLTDDARQAFKDGILGMRADLVIINGDPLSSITDLIQVEAVMLNGRYLQVDELLTSPSTNP